MLDAICGNRSKYQPAMKRDITDEAFCAIYRLPNQTLRGIKARGGDPHDARTIFAILRDTTRKPDAWREFFETKDEDTHDFWKKEETKEKVNKLRLQNSLIEGEQFKREDVDAATMALGTAFKLSLMEAKATLPPQLTGLTEAEIEKVLDAGFNRMLENLSELSSAMWNQIKAKYANGDDGQDSGPGGEGNDAKPGSKRKRVVPSKREAGSGTSAEP